MTAPAESQKLEWKESWRDEHLKVVCAFANAEGGLLVIGQNDKGRVTGIPNARRLLEELPNKARDILGIHVAVHLRTTGRKEYMEIEVESYSNPISYKGEYYQRSGSTNQILKGAALNRFMLRRHGRTWDSVPLPDIGVEDLDAEAVQIFRRLAMKSRRLPEALLNEPVRSLLEKLHLTEKHYLTRAAALLFHPDPECFFRGVAVKIGYFASESDLRYHDEVQGSLFVQIQKTLDLLLTKYLKAVISYEGIHRVESLPMPEPALREAVLNAIVHRDYSIPAPIQIRVYDNRLSIWNPGALPEDWTLEKLLGPHASQPSNPNIANAFSRAGEIETWGRGIERVFMACRDAGVPKPRVRVEPGDFWFEFPFSKAYIQRLAPGKAGRENSEKTTQETTETTQETTETTQETTETTQETTETTQETTETTQKRIIALLQNDPTLTRKMLAEQMNLTSDGIKYHLGKLRMAGLIHHIGPTKKGRWKVTATDRK